jgi:hypothetical protein
MGKLFVASAVLILAAGIPPLHAEDFPWCVKMDVFTRNCAFANYNECAAVAKNGGGTCIRNPNVSVGASATANPKAASKAAVKTSNKPQ